MFYLGRRVWLDGEQRADEPLFYDAHDLTTHAVCVGMTGSGKTGLGVVLAEEAVLSGVPTLVIDPKGDMTNLLLAFPSPGPEDLCPWVDVEGARRRGLSLDEYAIEVARARQEGLASWGIDRERVALYRQRAEFAIYTPGSDAGQPVSIVHSLHAPPLDWEQDSEALRETISSTALAILALLGIQSDPVTGREHILLSAIVEQAWRTGSDLDLAQLIVQVQTPPFDHLGAFPLETFYPESDRLALAMALNGLLASPRLAAWREGDPLDIEPMLRAPDGRPRVSIFTLGHLNDAERSFFVTLLLERLRAWLRLQDGTTDLRAMLYFDELYGYMPPHPSNPPTKQLLLSLLKQARSQGLGLVLATQNPVDLDYKGLSNAGTWFVGKLQTSNDRQRVMEGLGGASLEAGVSLDCSAFDEQIGQLGSRTFLLHNVHGDGPVLFRTRDTMCYLRGPLTRAQIRRLTREDESAPPMASSSKTTATGPTAVTRDQTPPSPVTEGPSRDAPVLPAGVAQYFVPVQVPLEWAIRSVRAGDETIAYEQQQLVYRAALYGRARVRIDSARYSVHEGLVVSRVIDVPDGDSIIDWGAEPLLSGMGELDSHPAQEGRFVPPPVLLGDARRLRSVEREFTDYVYRETRLALSYHSVLKLVAGTDESPSQFKRRCYQLIEEKRDAELRKVENRHQDEIDRLESRIRREARELEKDEDEFDARKREELVSAAESVLGLLTQRRQSRAFSVASRRRRLTRQAKADVQESLDALDDLEQQVEDLLAELEEERARIRERWSETADDLETIHLRPRKADIFVEDWGVAWVPYWDIVLDEASGRRQLSFPAFGSVAPGMPQGRAAADSGRA